MLTAADVTRNLLDFVGSTPEGSALRDARRAILDAYTEIADAHPWNYLKSVCRITTVAAYQTGTVVYDHTGGSSERLLTLTGGTFPTWVTEGDVVRIGEVSYEVAARIDGTNLQLSATLNPGADVASSAYSLYRDTYLLPADFRTGKTPIFESGIQGLNYVDPQSWLFGQRAWVGLGQPTRYTIVGSAFDLGRLVIKFSPAPDRSETLDFIYYRRPRALTIFDHAEGSVGVTSGAATLTGSATNWNDNMVGSVVRVSSSRTKEPTDAVGENPYAVESRIASFTSSTSMAMESNASVTYSDVKYTISDPIDLEGMLLVAFQRMAERNIAVYRRHDDKNAIVQIAEMALSKARAADNRSMATVNAGGYRGYAAGEPRYLEDPVS